MLWTFARCVILDHTPFKYVISHQETRKEWETVWRINDYVYVKVHRSVPDRQYTRFIQLELELSGHIFSCSGFYFQLHTIVWITDLALLPLSSPWSPYGLNNLQSCAFLFVEIFSLLIKCHLHLTDSNISPVSLDYGSLPVVPFEEDVTGLFQFEIFPVSQVLQCVLTTLAVNSSKIFKNTSFTVHSLMAWKFVICHNPTS